MKSYECLDFEKIKALAATVNTCEELVDKLQHDLKEYTLMRNIPVNFHNIRNVAIMSKTIEDIIKCLKMDIELLEEMKADEVILLSARHIKNETFCYMCTFNSESSEKYNFQSVIWDDEDEECVENIITDIEEKIGRSLKDDEDFYTYEFEMNLPKNIGTMDGLIAYMKGKIVLLTSMMNDGVYLPEDFLCDFEHGHLMEFRINDPEVAKKYGFKRAYDITTKKEKDADYYMYECELDDFFMYV